MWTTCTKIVTSFDVTMILGYIWQMSHLLQEIRGFHWESVMCNINGCQSWNHFTVKCALDSQWWLYSFLCMYLMNLYTGQLENIKLYSNAICFFCVPTFVNFSSWTSGKPLIFGKVIALVFSSSQHKCYQWYSYSQMSVHLKTCIFLGPLCTILGCGNFQRGNLA